MRIGGDGNVGIGKTVPSGRLHVENNSTGIIVANDQITGNAFEVFGAQGNLLTVTDDLSDSLFSVNDAAGMPVFEVFADDTIKSYRNNESKLEVDPENNRIRLRDNAFVSGNIIASGSVGIGTTSPARKLEIIQTTNQAAAAFETRENGGIAVVELRAKDLSNPTAALPANQGPALAFQGYNGSSFQSMATIFAAMEATAASNDMPSSLRFLTTPDGSASATEKMRIRSDGNVGIGTTDPDSLLTVSGDAQITGALNVAGNIEGGNYIYVGSRIRHVDDTNTSIDFGFDSIRLQVGGYDLFRVDEDDGNIVFNESSHSSIDVRMESNSKTNMFFLDGSEDRIGIGTTQPATEFEVHGVISGVCNSNYYARFEHRDTDGGNQGSNTLGYNTRTVNTTTVNHGGFASLPGSNEIRLAAGEYYTNIEVVSSMGESFTELTDGSTTVTTADGTTLQSTNTFGGSADWVPHTIKGIFTLSSQSDLTIRTFAADTNSDDGLGRSIDNDTTYTASDYEADVYLVAEFWKIG